MNNTEKDGLLKCPVCQNTLCECNKSKKIEVGNDIVIPGFTIPLFVENFETFWYLDKKTNRLYVGKVYNLKKEV